MYPECSCEELLEDKLCDMPDVWKKAIIYSLCKLNDVSPRHCEIDFNFYLEHLPTKWRKALVEVICDSYALNCLDMKTCKKGFIDTLSVFPENWRNVIIEFICSVIACRGCEEEEEDEDDDVTTTTTAAPISPDVCPDFTPVISIAGLSFPVGASKHFLVCLNEISQVSGSIGQLQFKINKLNNFTIVANPAASVFGDTGENSKWTITEDANFLIATLNIGESIPANSFGCVGFTITRDADTLANISEYIIANITADSGGDCNPENNLVATIVTTIGGPTTSTTTTTTLAPEFTTTTTTSPPEPTTTTTTSVPIHYIYEGIEYIACGTCQPQNNLVVESYNIILQVGYFYKAIDFDTTGRIFEITSSALQYDDPVVYVNTAVGAPNHTCRGHCTDLPRCKTYEITNPETGAPSDGYYTYYDCENTFQERTIPNAAIHEICAQEGSVARSPHPSSNDLIITLMGDCQGPPPPPPPTPPIYFYYYVEVYDCPDCEVGLAAIGIVGSEDENLIIGEYYQDVEFEETARVFKIITIAPGDPGYVVPILSDISAGTCNAACEE